MNLFKIEIGFQVGRIDLSQANAFVKKHHRHSKPTIGHIFSLGLYDNSKLVGVAICGRPVSRHFDNGKTLEVYRLCTDGTKNACSKLYSACCKYAKAKDFEKVITYTLQSENGASLKASNFILENEKAGGLKWTGKRKHESTHYKKQWAYYLVRTLESDVLLLSELFKKVAA